ncbi:MAG: RNA-binding protein [Bacteroides sp.]|jgi:RNA recognition motif-containing protein|nr:RNA-binding protein [Bacteroides sp.]
MNIFVSSLSYNTTSEGLTQLFSEYGEVTSANVIMDKFTGRSRGFGFVEMPDSAAAQKAIDELNGTELDGKTINVNVARPRTERSDDNRSNRNGNGGGYRRY